MNKNRAINNLVLAVLGTLYCWSVSMAVVNFSFLTISAMPLLLLCALAMIVVLILSYTKKSLLIGLLILAVLFGVRLILGIKSGETAVLIDQISYVFQMLIGSQIYNTQYNLQMIIVVVLFIAIFVCFSLKTIFNFYLLAGLGIGMYCILLNQSAKIGIEFYVLLFVLLCLLLSKLFAKYRRKNQLTGVDIGKFMLRTLPIALVVVLISAVIALPFSGTKQSELFQYQTLDELINIGLKGLFTGKSQFHKGEVQLGGNLRLDDTPVLTVQSDESLYLYGSISDQYTGTSWKQSVDETSGLSSDYSTVDYATASMIDQTEYAGMFSKKSTVEVTYLTNQKAVFLPTRFSSIIGLQDTPLINTTGEIEVQSAIKAKNGYKVLYLPEHTAFIASTQDLSARLYGLDFSQAHRPRNVFDNQTMRMRDVWTEQMADQYKSNIYDTYTALPDTVTQRTKDLANELTKDRNSSSSKAQAIKEYLIAYYTYSLEPGAIQPGNDFVDQFLFESKKGYCTSFASAMSILCRSIDIPTRYVEGYAMPAKPDGDGRYTVRSRNAHAWAEVYLDNYGWLKYETTPPYSSAENESSGDILLDESTKDSQEFKQHLEDIGVPQPENPNTAPIPTPVESTSPTGEDEQITEPIAPVPFAEKPSFNLIAFLIVLFGLGFAFMVRIRSRKQRELNRTHRDNRLARESFEQIIRLAKFCGLPTKSSETPIAFAQRLVQTFEPVQEKAIVGAELYCAMQYGGFTLSEEQVEVLYDTYLIMDQIAQDKSNRLHYLWCKYIIQSI